MLEWKTFTCHCCGVDYETELEKYSPTPFQCSECMPHRDAETLPELLAQREDHRRLWAVNVADLHGRIEEAERHAQSAYHTRGLALEVLNKINAKHDLRPSGECSCRVKGCSVGPTIGGQKIISNLVRRYDAREQKRLREIARRDGFWDAADEWDRFIDEPVVYPDRSDDAGDGGAVSANTA